MRLKKKERKKKPSVDMTSVPFNIHDTTNVDWELVREAVTD